MAKEVGTNMLTANRFDEIKSLLRKWTAGEYSEDDVPPLVMRGMIRDLAAEIDRLRTPAQVGGRGHIKPVILDSQGHAVAPPPIAHQLVVERREQYDADRFEAVMALPDIDPWRVFSLRWGLSPPPGGWSNPIVVNVIHAVRLSLKAVPYIDKHISAMVLTSQGIKLPPGMTLIDGVLRGIELPDTDLPDPII